MLISRLCNLPSTEFSNIPRRPENDHLDGLWSLFLSGLANMVNLRSFSWIIPLSLDSRILHVLLNHQSLRNLNISGPHDGNDVPAILPQFTSVRRIRLILSSPPVTEILPVWFKSLAAPLQSLSIGSNVGTARLVPVLSDR